MMSKGLTTQQFCRWSRGIFGLSLYATIALGTGTIIAAPTDKLAKLNDWRFYPKALQLEIILSTGKTPTYFYLPQPPRLVVDIPDTKLGYVPTLQNYTGAIQRIRVSQLNATITRIVLDLAPGTFIDPNQVRLQPVSRKNPTRWVLRPLVSTANSSLQPTKFQPSPNNLPPKPNYSQPTNNLLLYSTPQLPSSLPVTLSPQQPLITAPPLSPVTGSILPPPNFPNQVGNLNSVPSMGSPNFPSPTIPNIPNYPANGVNPVIIEFGQPLPKAR
jgi:AMIN domain